MNKERLRQVLPKSLIPTLKLIRNLYRGTFYYYETKAAPFIAFNLTFLMWPLFKICESLKFCFLANIPDSDGVGHIIVETDNFFRMQFLNELDPSKKYILIKKSHHISKQYLSLYKSKFHFSICNSFIYYITLPMLIRYPSITLDCGLTNAKWHLINPKDERKEKGIPLWPKLVTKQKNLSEWEDRAYRRSKSSHFFPLKNVHIQNKQLDRFLHQSEGKKMALIHLKSSRIVNATAKNTDGYTYLPTLEHLSKSNYYLVFIGREKMPNVFNNYNVLNYSESKIASFKNDIDLFKRADLAITGGSGIFLMAECMNVNLLYLNYWHLYRLPASRNCICIPTLVQDPSGQFLKFSEQWDLYKNANDWHSEIFPSDQFEARNVASDEILAGCQELLSRGEKLTDLQQKFAKTSDYYYGESRVSNYFLQKHEHLF